jgi:hypothetical protein
MSSYFDVNCTYQVHEMDSVRDKEQPGPTSVFQTPVSSPKGSPYSSRSLIKLGKAELRKQRKSTTPRDVMEQSKQQQAQLNKEDLTKIWSIHRNISHNFRRAEFLSLARKLLTRLEHAPKIRYKSRKNEEILWSSYKGLFVQYPDLYVEDSKVMGTKFEGISYYDWYELIVKTVELLVQAGEKEEANLALQQALDRQIYFNDPKRKYEIALLILSNSG